MIRRPLITFFLLVLIGLNADAIQPGDLAISPTALTLTAADGSARDLPIRSVTGDNTYLTSVAIAPWDSSRLIVSTTFHGLYESVDGGSTWADLGDREELQALYRGSGFYEDVSAVAYDRADRRALYVELAQTGETTRVVRGAVEPASFTDIPDDPFRSTIRTVWPEFQDTERMAARRAAASDKRAFYLSTWQLDAQTLAEHLRFARENDLNAVVIDFKDDMGRVPYNSAVPLAHEIGAVTGAFNADRVISAVHDEGLYLIARIVVFKDRKLFAFQDSRYGLWDREENRPWGVFRDGEQIEHWVDPYSEFVWQYTIAIARELVERGVDEIQFDYIRTPSDGNTRSIEYRFRSGSPALYDEDPRIDDRVEAISAFLARARDEIPIPVSIDVFGFNGWYRMGYLGQDIGALSQYVDVICPMLYPSHFDRDFAADLPYLLRAQRLYRDGVARAQRIGGDTVLIRPYIQAFLIGGELNFEEPEYTDYLKHQIVGAHAGGASGYTLWNYSGRYYMVARGLESFSLEQ